MKSPSFPLFQRGKTTHRMVLAIFLSSQRRMYRLANSVAYVIPPFVKGGRGGIFLN